MAKDVVNAALSDGSQEREQPRHVAMSPPPPVQQRTILIYDVNPLIARGLANLLLAEAPELRPVCALVSAQQLEDVIRTAPPDALLLSMTSTREILRRTSIWCSTRVVVISGGEDDEDDVLAVLRAGARAYVDKEFGIHEIVEAVDLVLRGHIVVPERVLLACLAHEGPGVHGLTELEIDILRAITRGETNRELATTLHLSERTVRRHVLRLYAKLHVATRLDAALFAVRLGLTSTEADTRT